MNNIETVINLILDGLPLHKDLIFIIPSLFGPGPYWTTDSPSSYFAISLLLERESNKLKHIILRQSGSLVFRDTLLFVPVSRRVRPCRDQVILFVAIYY